ncbi:hypothetical protein AV521_36060 [Streptomyces sp. IMTB 2501]|uniref:hypothetical protein n=1 Tax=Streptomyces sp. IMTB 2501 TaxID=1776340 RepID=UPI00096CF8C9|nr:hypothetical protein [Streptomyces sp. IMTB 2501]OLZ64214.1 hypothetical protein AV521_36060 [Streptomyces sp. IMTB 2501]
MRLRLRRDLVIAGSAIAVVVLVHVLLTLEIVRVGQRWLGGIAIGLLVAVVAALHAAAFRRLTVRRGRRSP